MLFKHFHRHTVNACVLAVLAEVFSRADQESASRVLGKLRTCRPKHLPRHFGRAIANRADNAADFGNPLQSLERQSKTFFKSLFDNNFRCAADKTFDHCIASRILVVNNDEIALVVNVIALCGEFSGAALCGICHKMRISHQPCRGRNEKLPLIPRVRDKTIDDLGHRSGLVLRKPLLRFLSACSKRRQRTFGGTAQLVCVLIDSSRRFAELCDCLIIDAAVSRDGIKLTEVGLIKRLRIPALFFLLAFLHERKTLKDFIAAGAAHVGQCA